MSKLWLLTKTLYKNLKEGNADKKQRIKTILLWVFVIICLLPLLISFIYLMNTSYDTLVKIHQEGILLGLGIAAICLVIFFFGIFQVINTFYFSKDVEYLLPLPLKPWQILGAKFGITIFYEYITEIFFFLPILIEFGIKSSAGPLYYVYGIVIFASLPLIPIIIAALISMVIMRFTNVGKHKEVLKVIGGVIAMAAALGFNMAIQYMGNGKSNPQDVVNMLLKGNNSFVNTITNLFPTSRFAVQSLLKSSSVSGFLYLLIFVAISAVLFAAMLVLSQGLYFKGVIGVSEAFSKRKKLSSSEFEKSTVKSSAIKSYTVKELKLMFRTSIYFMNCVLMNFIWPVFFIPVLIQKNTMTEFKKLGVLFNNSTFGGKAIAFTMLFLVFILSSNAIAGTSISREGKNIYVAKYLPIGYKQQLMAKVYSQIILNIVSIVIGIVFLKALLNIPMITMLLIVVMGILISFFSAMSGILVDLRSPKLNWDSEQKAVKQNFNAFAAALISYALGGILTFLIVYFDVKLWPAFIIIAALFAASDFILYNLICTKGVETFRKLEG